MVENLEERLDNLSDPLTIEEVRSDLILKYAKLKLRAKDNGEKGFDSDSDTEGDEIALVAGGSNKNYTKKFKGTCYKCSTIGHKVVDCKENNGNSHLGENTGRQFGGKCHHCDIWGHKKADCRKLKAENVQKQSLENANVEEEDEEIALLCRDVVEPNGCISNNCEGCQKVRKLKQSYIREVTMKEKVEVEMILTTVVESVKIHEKTESVGFSNNNSLFGSLESDNWIIDSGASSHVTYSVRNSS